MWPEGPQRERVLEEKGWFRQIRIMRNWTRKSVVIALRWGLRRSRKWKGSNLCDKAQGKLYEGAHLEAEQGVICGFWWVQPHDEPWRIVLTSWKVGTVEGRRNRRRHLTSHRACWWRPLEPCPLERETNECLACADKEFGVNWINSRSRNAGPVHPSRVLHQRRRANHRARATRREDVHPRHKRHKRLGHVNF